MELDSCKIDLWGYPVRCASDACMQHINSYYEQVLSYGSKQKVISKAVEEDGHCALAHALLALYALRSSSEDARSSIAAAKSCLLDATPYEKMVVAAAEALVEDQWDTALSAYAKILQDFPRDLFSLKRAQVLCFYMGKSKESLRLALKVLPFNKEQPYMHGMLAFAQLETCRYDEAEAAAREGLAIEDSDQWAKHALCHVLQYRCLFQEAVTFMERNSQSWNKCCSFMYSHNWWHLAVSYLDWGCHHALDKVVEIYDAYIWPARCRDLGGSVQAFLSALGLLLRLELRGYKDHVQERIMPVAQQLCDTSLWHKESLLDVLAVWALAYSGQASISNTLLEQLEHRVEFQNHEDKYCFVKLIKGLHEYGRRNVMKASSLLGPSFSIEKLKAIGASDEQLDVFEELWCVVSLQAGLLEAVSWVLKQRIKVFHGSPFGWELMAELYRKTGSPNEAQSAASQAGLLQGSYLEFTSSQSQV